MLYLTKITFIFQTTLLIHTKIQYNSKNGKYQQVKNFTVRRPESPLMFVTW